MMFHMKLGFDFDWPSGFREEDRFQRRRSLNTMAIYIDPGWGQTSPYGPIFFSDS